MCILYIIQVEYILIGNDTAAMAVVKVIYMLTENTDDIDFTCMHAYILERTFALTSHIKQCPATSTFNWHTNNDITSYMCDLYYLQSTIHVIQVS